MITLNLILVLAIIALGVWVWRLKNKVAHVEIEKEIVLAGAGFGEINQKRSQVKSERKEEILNFIKENGKATNNEIEKLLSVSDSSATNYLDELESEAKIRQVGQTGTGVYYELNG